VNGALKHSAWLCDLDGTLYRDAGLKLLMGAELLVLGFRQLKIIHTFRREHERLRDPTLPRRPASTPFNEQLARTAELLQVPEATVRASVERWMIERPARWLRRFRRESLVRELTRFRALGGKTAVVSDYPARRKLQALGLDAMFDVVVANGEPEGPAELKPKPDGYLKAARTLRVAPQECLVIGNRDDADGAAARAAGMAFRLIR
jgi:HAD superfamily hydrolase (TIGR01509 family)